MSNRGTKSFVFRLAAEFVVIVVGVLVALGVDSWATSQRERALESEYLARLLDDVRFDLEELAMVDSVSRTGIDASQQLTDPSVLETMSPGQVVSAVWAVANTRIADLSRTTFQELINSGQIEVIQSHAVRRALASYDRSINEMAGAWNGIAPDLLRWYAARVPGVIGDRMYADSACARGVDRGLVNAFSVICDVDLTGWSSEAFEGAVRSEAGQEMLRMAGHNYRAHAFFVAALTEEARALERVLADALAGT
jgi:hypothetical protein